VGVGRMQTGGRWAMTRTETRLTRKETPARAIRSLPCGNLKRPGGRAAVAVLRVVVAFLTGTGGPWSRDSDRRALLDPSQQRGRRWQRGGAEAGGCVVIIDLSERVTAR
jgi:hypothetical protein